MAETKPQYIIDNAPIIAVDSAHLRILQQVADGSLDVLDAAKELAAHQRRAVSNTLDGALETDEVLLPDLPTIVWIGQRDESERWEPESPPDRCGYCGRDGGQCSH